MMKSQNDLIVAGAVVLVCIGVSIGFMMTARKPVAPPIVKPINVADAAPPKTDIVMSDALPGGTGGGLSGSGTGTRRGK